MSNSADIHFNFPVTNSFVYFGKDFPFNMKLFNCFSDYFISNPSKIQQNGKIYLIEESDGNIIIPDESINDFVNYCQNKTITLKDENVPALYKLSKKYLVTNLIESIENYILNHPENLIIQFLTISQTKQNQNTEHYENILSMNLPDYIKDDSLLSLPLPTINRIVTKYQLNYRNPNHPSIIDFLLRCLNKYGKKASVLFRNVDFTKEDPSYLRKLLDEYSDKFDFNFIQTAYHKTIYDIQSEIRQKEASIRSHEEKISFQIQELNQNLNEKIGELNEKVTQQSEIIRQLKTEISYLKRPRVSCPFLSISSPKGIISYLNEIVSLSFGGYNNNNIQNLKDNSNNNYFHNYCSNDKTNKQEDSYILFDFGISNKVILHSYLIRTNCNGKSAHYHSKSWKIEGSNDKANWICLDNRINDDNLNDSYKQHLYICEQSKYSDLNEGFRYVRYVQNDSWCDKMDPSQQNPFNIYIIFFEFFGDVYQFC